MMPAFSHLNKKSERMARNRWFSMQRRLEPMLKLGRHKPNDEYAEIAALPKKEDSEDNKAFHES